MDIVPFEWSHRTDTARFLRATSWPKTVRLLHGHRAASVECRCGDRAMLSNDMSAGYRLTNVKMCIQHVI